MSSKDWFGLCLLVLATSLPQSAIAEPATQPNIVVFLVDDLGYGDLGCYGSQFYETPNIDRLASEGMRFTDGYAACPVCSPTRASMMTGQWPQRVGITDYIGAPAPEQWKRNTPLLPAAFSDRLAKGTPTLATMLKSQNYQTFFAGKWHLGPEGSWPEDHGFDVNKGGIDRGGPYGGDKYFSPYGNPRLDDGPAGEHLPDRLARETSDFISEHRDQPFFAYLSFYSVHTPLMAREDLKEKYQQKRSKMGLEAAWGREGDRDVRLVQEHPVYAGMVEAMDQAVGTVLETLQREGLAENTLVIFTSDNGGLSTSEGWPTSNLPLRGGKGWIYEGGIREPWIVRWPGHVARGSVNSTPICSPDLFPTLAQVSGAVTDASVDGVSLVPVFEGDKIEERALCWHYPHYGNQGGAPAAAIRRGDWKLVEWMEDQRVELFDLSGDIGELNDVANAQPEVVAELRDELREWQKRVGAVFPRPNPEFETEKRSGRAADRRR